jgi:2-(1,2-epoxy-1,2-dihydrophenyl)acetyl-CoA isomerase
MIKGLRVETSGGVARLTFDRPEARNALSPDLLQAFGMALRQAEDDPSVRCIVISGAGEHFVGGGDVKGFGETVVIESLERKHLYEQRLGFSSSVYAVLERIGKPTIARVKGAVAGAGISLVLACDFAIAGVSTFVVFAHRSLSLPPDGALSYFLPRIVGWRRAKQLTLLGARLESQQALDEGILTQLVADDQLDVAVSALLEQLLAGPPVGARATKRLLNASLHNGIAEQTHLEAQAVGECVASEDFAEGVRAFLEKRKPVFSGR